MSDNTPDKEIPALQSDFQIAWELSKGRDKPFFIDTFRKLLNQFDREEISMSKMVEELNVAAYKWRYHQSPVAERDEREPYDKFEVGVEKLINSLSLENKSDTPDYISAELIRKVFELFNKAIKERTRWYSPGETPSHEGKDADYWKQLALAAGELLSCVPIDASMGRINLYLAGFDEALKKYQSLKQQK